MDKGEIAQNQVNAPTFSKNQNVADKHLDFVNQSKLPQDFSKQSTQVPQQRFINPNNYKQVLGPDNVIEIPENQEQSKPDIQLLQQTMNQHIRQTSEQVPIEYNNLIQQQPINHNSNDTLKLVIYVVPVIAMLFLVLKTVEDSDFMWHVRQSLVAQGVWYGVLIFLRLMDLPLLSVQGVLLWNLSCFGMLIYAGAKAYNHEKYQIPVVYSLGKNFIENK